MLSNCIKSTILVILIILIFHFLIKTIIVERSGGQLQIQPKIPSTEKFLPYELTPESEQQLSKEQVCQSIRLDDKQQKKLEQEEMMKYVAMGDDQEDSKTLDQYFSDNIVSKDVQKLEENICKFKADNQQLPLSTTCNSDTQKLALTNDMAIRADCNLKQDKKNIMILTEYEDEKDMNGGKLFGGLDAFDTFDENYQQYSEVG